MSFIACIRCRATFPQTIDFWQYTKRKFPYPYETQVPFKQAMHFQLGNFKSLQ